MTSEQNPSHCSNLVGLLQWRAREQPDALALAYLDDELNISASLTYRQLERKALSIGAHLSRRVSPGERVLLVYPENIAFLPAFYDCLYAGLVTVPVIFPDPERLPRLLPRIQKIITDSESRLVLAPKEAILSLGSIFGDQLVATDALPDDGGEDWQPSYAGQLPRPQPSLSSRVCRPGHQERCQHRSGNGVAHAGRFAGNHIPVPPAG
jgi:acyl-CoA synthetase (AMP-forming)/AMP-acid ligase II